MSQTFYAGLVACAGSSSGAVTTTGFDNVTVLGGGIAPSAASNLTATATGSRSIDLSWMASTDAASYVVKRATTTGGPYITITNGVSHTTYTDTGLEWHSTYYYKISAANLAGESANTSEASATTFDPPIPPTPLNLTAASDDANVTLTWSASNDASIYNIKRASQFTGPYVNLGTTSSTSYSDVGLTNGVTYYYKVSAANYVGESQYSSAIGSKPYTNRIGYWAFNESSGKVAFDSWGGQNGALASSASFTSGKAGNAVSLDGTANGYVQLPTSIVSGITNFTIASWVKLNTSSNWVRLFDFGSSTSINIFLTTRNGSNGYLRYAITTGGNTNNIEQQINTSYTMPLDEWVHIAITLSDNLGIIYINGVEVGRNASMTLNPSSLGSTTNNYIGKSQYNDPLLNGMVDDFRLYNKALSTDEIVALMSAPTYTAVINHAPTINGTVEGSIQVLSAESINLNGNTVITGELLVAGSPKIILNGKPTLNEVLEGVGNALPDTHTITINGNATLNCLMRRTDATAMPTLPETTDVEIKDIVVNAGESLILPAGTYGNIIVNDQGRLTIDGTLILTGGLTLNGNAAFFGKVVAPQGTVIINGNSTFTGSVVADRLIINGNGLLKKE